MNIRLTGLVLLLLASATAFTVASVATPLRNRSNPTSIVSVQVLSDGLAPIQGGVVKLDNGLESCVLVTDAAGQSPWRELDTTSGVELTIDQSVVPGGVALGKIEFLATPAAPPGVDGHTVSISRTQRVAETVGLTGAMGKINNVYPADGAYPHWILGVPVDSPLRLSTQVAPLLDFPEIESFAAYRGHSFDQGQFYSRGVVMIMPRIQLGAEGLLVAIDLLGEYTTSAPTIDLYQFTDTPSGSPGSLPLDVTMVGHDDGSLIARVSGGVAGGHLALLVRPDGGSPPQVFTIQDNHPVITVPPDAGDGIVRVTPTTGDGIQSVTDGSREWGDAGAAAPRLGPRAAFYSDCEPEVPGQPPFNCTPPTPATDCSGGAALLGPADCQSVRMRSIRWCKDPSSTVGIHHYKTRSWKVKFELETFGGNPLTSSGGFEYGEEAQEGTTEGWTAQAGEHGLGQCMRQFRWEWTCMATWEIEVDKLVFEDMLTHILPCAEKRTVTTVCRDTHISEASCDRTP